MSFPFVFLVRASIHNRLQVVLDETEHYKLLIHKIDKMMVE